MQSMELDPRADVAVRPAAAFAARPRLFAALSAAFDVTFRPWTDDAGGHDGLLEIAEHGTLPRVEGSLPTFAVCGAAPSGTEAQVALRGASGLDSRLRGIAVVDRLGGSALEPRDAGEVLATVGAEAAWTRSAGPVASHRVRSTLPELGPEEVLYALVTGRTLTLVALVQFLRELSAPAGWRPPPLRASIVFDDPNLRWRRYGFIDYTELLAHADRHDYHASMAMIPLDAGRQHGPTVALFRRRRDRLSVVIHGNDHVKRELLDATDPGDARATAAQALGRMMRLERLSGLPVDRVMMPPHGLCSPAMTGALGAVGFDALCAIHPLPWTERRPAEPPLAGWRPGGFLGGCAVITRIPLSSLPADIALRAFLDQPIVLYGHHEDAKDGLDPLASAAAAVNRLGPVRWSSVGEIARSNHALRVSGDRAVVRPYARSVRVTVPPGVGVLSVEEPGEPLGESCLNGWSADAGAVRPFGEQLPLSPGRVVTLRLHGPADVDPRGVGAPAWRPWPRLRRAATEARDRSLPLRPARAG